MRCGVITQKRCTLLRVCHIMEINLALNNKVLGPGIHE